MHAPCVYLLLYLYIHLLLFGDSPVAQMAENLPAMQETWVQPLGEKDPLEEEMASTPIFSPGAFHGQRSLAATVHGVAESDTTERLTHLFGH